MQKLLIATHNQGKLNEYRALLADLDLDVMNLNEAQIDFDVEETGTTFAENAILKARTYAEASGMLTWADDSGLEVDALDGRPGVYSARYAGPGASDADRYRKLITDLQQQGSDKPWSARFRCVVALASPDGRVETTGDTVEGVIIETPRGDHGFGYDPIFYLSDRDATMAELSAEIKNQISHRGKAAATAKNLLSLMIASEL